MSMFTRISYRIAFQFTAFVLMLLLINGALFLTADYENARRMEYRRLGQAIELLQYRRGAPIESLINRIPPPIRDRIRILTTEGEELYSSPVFSLVPIAEKLEDNLNKIFIQDEPYSVLTQRVIRNGQHEGFVQIIAPAEQRDEALARRIALYLIVSTVVSLLIFWVGIYFAKRSLRPAEAAMQRLEQFTQDASHELRTPLATLNSTLDLALKSKTYEEGIRSAKQDITKLAELVEKLLELTQLDGLLINTNSVDLSAITNSVTDDLRNMTQEKKMTLETQISRNIQHHADPALYEQVLRNLILNAIKFTNTGGTIRVSLEQKLLRVSDTGPGIPTHDLPHIFDRFYQADTSRTKEGFGLGLALVQRIVELHGWHIDARNTDSGAEFVVRFS